jgi:hypothetical protein
MTAANGPPAFLSPQYPSADASDFELVPVMNSAVVDAEPAVVGVTPGVVKLTPCSPVPPEIENKGE